MFMDQTNLPFYDVFKDFVSSQKTILSCFLFLSPGESDTWSHRRSYTLAADPNEMPKYGEQKDSKGGRGEREQKTNK